MRNDIKKESRCCSCKRAVFCGNAASNRLRFWRRCGSGHKHLEYGQITGRVGSKQRGFPCDRRSSGGFAVC